MQLSYASAGVILGRLVLVLAAFLSSPAGMPGSVSYGDEAMEQAEALSSRDDARLSVIF